MGLARNGWRTAVLALAIAVMGVACTDPGPGEAAGTGDRADDGLVTVEETGGRGPLCDHLPRGDDPGSPASIAGLTLDEALGEVPVLTVFSSAAERTALGELLRTSTALTLLVPMDDAFYLRFGDDEWDDLMVRRTGDLESVLAGHVAEGRADLDALLAAGTVTAVDGSVLQVEQPYGEGVAHIGGQADVLCADLEAANGVIHILEAVLGD